MEREPFDLQRALAGDRVVTGEGIPVTSLVLLDVTADSQALFGIVHYGPYATYAAGWNTHGKSGNGYCDLYMAHKSN